MPYQHIWDISRKTATKEHKHSTTRVRRSHGRLAQEQHLWSLEWLKKDHPINCHDVALKCPRVTWFPFGLDEAQLMECLSNSYGVTPCSYDHSFRESSDHQSVASPAPLGGYSTSLYQSTIVYLQTASGFRHRSFSRFPTYFP